MLIIIGISKKGSRDTNNIATSIKFDILVPFKNEAQKLPGFLEGLTQQSYPKDAYRVIFINDNSTDNSCNVIRNAIPNFPGSILIDNIGRGKKQALVTGMNHTKNDYILTTDADTKAECNWILSHALAYTMQKCDFVIGSVKMESRRKSFMNCLQITEYKLINAITQGTAKLGHPVMCSGANLSFNKAQVNDYTKAIRQEYQSGDDMFLLEYFKSIKANIATTQMDNSQVAISPEPWRRFIKQRMRWAGKAKGYHNRDIVSFGFITAFQNIALLILGILMLFKITDPVTGLILLAIKWLADISLLIFSNKTHFIENLFLGNIIFLIYPFYVSFSIIGGLIGSFKSSNIST